MKAFVGPLGDDLPSIFPIVAGVLLFLGTLAYGAGVVDEKNAYFNSRKATLGIAYLLTQKGDTTPMEFQSLCETQAREYARSKGVKFHAALVPQCDGVEFKEEFGESIGLGSDYGECDSSDDTGGEYDYSLVEDRNPAVMTYPIAVPCPDENSYTKGLGLVVVTVWR